MLTAYSEATGISIDKLIQLLGHDGEEVIRPDFPEPFNKRGFYTSEFNNILYPLGWRFTEFIVGHVDISPYMTKDYNYIAYNTRHCKNYNKTTTPCVLHNLQGIIIVDYQSK